MSKESDSFCPACRLGLCNHCSLASREWDDPTACLCDCEWATGTREELRREQGIPERTYYPATAKEPTRKGWPDLADIKPIPIRPVEVKPLDP